MPLVSDSVKGRLVDLGGIDDDVNTDDEQEECAKDKQLKDLKKAIEAFKAEGGFKAYVNKPVDGKSNGFVRNLDLIRNKGLMI